MILVKRSELLDSESAVRTLGKTYLPVEKERYWFIKTLSKLNKAIDREKRVTQNAHNEMLNMLGKIQENGKKGLLPDDPDMQKYVDGMEVCGNEEVEVDVQKISIDTLQKASVTMIAEEQVKIMWLLDESNVVPLNVVTLGKDLM